jgi:hypothetical protein
VNIKLPYLVEINREKLERTLGADVRVTRTAIMLPLGDDDTWQLRLLDLKYLGQSVREGMGM